MEFYDDKMSNRFNKKRSCERANIFFLESSRKHVKRILTQFFRKIMKNHYFHFDGVIFKYFKVVSIRGTRKQFHLRAFKIQFHLKNLNFFLNVCKVIVTQLKKV